MKPFYLLLVFYGEIKQLTVQVANLSWNQFLDSFVWIPGKTWTTNHFLKIVTIRISMYIP